MAGFDIGGGADLGSLMSGFVNVMQAKKQQQMQADEQSIRSDFMKAQKRIIDAQFKHAEMEDQWWSSQPQDVQKLRFLPKEAQTIGMIMAGINMPPGIGGSTASAPEQEWKGVPFALPEETAQAPAAAPQGGGNLIAQAQNNPLLAGLLKKELGINYGETHPRSIAGPGGAPITQYFDIQGNPIPGRSYQEAVKPEPMTFTDEKGNVSTQYVNPYSPPTGMIQTKKGGGKDSMKSIYQANIEKVGIPAIDNLVKNSFESDGKGNLKLTMAARLQGTAPQLAQQAGGEIANDALKLAYSLLRPESGAAISVGELTQKINAQLPKLFTSDKYAANQFLQVGDVIDEYLQGIDPEYTPRARALIEQRMQAAKGLSKKKPSLSIGQGARKPLSSFEGQ